MDKPSSTLLAVSLLPTLALSSTDYGTTDQLTVTGGGSASPAVVSLPGAYKASDPGILVNIHAKLATYAAPGPTVYGGGTTKSAGAACVGVEAVKTTGPAVTQIQTGSPSSPTGGSGSPPAGCTVAKYAQCGGEGYTGCTTCDVSFYTLARSVPQALSYSRLLYYM